MTTTTDKPAQEDPAPIIAYKGFDKNLQCRGWQFEVGKTYTHDGEVLACSSGFHSCENPFDVWNYYGPADGNRFALVEASGEFSRHAEDSKLASAKLSVSVELALPEFIRRGVEYLLALTKSGDSSKLAASGYGSKLAASGDSSQLAASGGSSRLAASGYGSQLAASGGSSRLAASGDSSKLAAAGDSSRLAASGDSSKLAAAGDSSRLAASGDSSQLAASGDSSKLAASGYGSKLAASGDSSVALAAGYHSSASAGANGVIALTYLDNNRPRVVVGYVGENGIKANTFYRVYDGELVEV